MDMRQSCGTEYKACVSKVVQKRKIAITISIWIAAILYSPYQDLGFTVTCTLQRGEQGSLYSEKFAV